MQASSGLKLQQQQAANREMRRKALTLEAQLQDAQEELMRTRARSAARSLDNQVCEVAGQQVAQWGHASYEPLADP